MHFCDGVSGIGVPNAKIKISKKKFCGKKFRIFVYMILFTREQNWSEDTRFRYKECMKNLRGRRITGVKCVAIRKGNARFTLGKIYPCEQRTNVPSVYPWTYSENRPYLPEFIISPDKGTMKSVVWLYQLMGDAVFIPVGISKRRRKHPKLETYEERTKAMADAGWTVEYS